MSLFTTIKNRKRYGSGVSENDEQGRRITKIIVGLILVVIIVVMLSPYLIGIKVTLNIDNFEVKTTLKTYSINYVDIDEIKLIDELPKSRKVTGVNSLGLDSGKYKCDEYGEYLRATYSNNHKFILIERENELLFVFNCKDDEQTIATYNEILNYLS